MLLSLTVQQKSRKITTRVKVIVIRPPPKKRTRVLTTSDSHIKTLLSSTTPIGKAYGRVGSWHGFGWFWGIWGYVVSTEDERYRSRYNKGKALFFIFFRHVWLAVGEVLYRRLQQIVENFDKTFKRFIYTLKYGTPNTFYLGFPTWQNHLLLVFYIISFKILPVLCHCVYHN